VKKLLLMLTVQGVWGAVVGAANITTALLILYAPFMARSEKSGINFF
jgi:hypothetical protein